MLVSLLVSAVFAVTLDQGRIIPSEVYRHHGNGHKLLPWVPTGNFKSSVPDDCRPAAIESQMQRPDAFQTTQAFFRHCEKYFWPDTRPYNRHVVLQRFDASIYNSSDNSAIHPIGFQLKSGRIVRGLLGIQPGHFRRPLILARCGVFCNASDSPPTGMIFSHFFEESEFNVLMLGSNSGDQFAGDNVAVQAGGFEEAAQAFEVLEILLKSNFENEIGGVHFFGISLGGHGALYASRMAALRPELPIRSSIAVAPVVDLRHQLEISFSGSVRGKVFGLLTNSYISNLVAAVPFLYEAISDRGWSPTAKLESLVAASLKALSETNTFSQYSSFLGVSKIEDEKTLWSVSDFSKYANQPGVPTLVVYAPDDFVVDSEINSEKLRAVAEGDPSYTFLRLSKGNHGAFATTLGWPAYSALLRGWVNARERVTLKPNTIDFSPKMNYYKPSWNPDWKMSVEAMNQQMDRRFVDLGFRLSPNEKSTQIEVWFKLFNPGYSTGDRNDHCGFYERDIFAAPNYCYSFIRSSISRSEFLKAFGKLKHVSGREDKGMSNNFHNVFDQKLEVWLNLRVTPVGGNSKWYGSESLPDFFAATSDRWD